MRSPLKRTSLHESKSHIRQVIHIEQILYISLDEECDHSERSKKKTSSRLYEILITLVFPYFLVAKICTIGSGQESKFNAIRNQIASASNPCTSFCAFGRTRRKCGIELKRKRSPKLKLKWVQKLRCPGLPSIPCERLSKGEATTTLSDFPSFCLIAHTVHTTHTNATGSNDLRRPAIQAMSTLVLIYDRG
eukprot:scaffold9511_cov182-Skeletonema_dohrnii-CCMP3373.AAC.19